MPMFLKRLLALLPGANRTSEPAWLIDRDGRVYKPARRVVLRAKAP